LNTVLETHLYDTQTGDNLNSRSVLETLDASRKRANVTSSKLHTLPLLLNTFSKLKLKIVEKREGCSEVYECEFADYSITLHIDTYSRNKLNPPNIKYPHTVHHINHLLEDLNNEFNNNEVAEDGETYYVKLKKLFMKSFLSCSTIATFEADVDKEFGSYTISYSDTKNRCYAKIIVADLQTA
jgi:hypothetical protein